MKYGSSFGGVGTAQVKEEQDTSARYWESNAEKHKSNNEDEAVERKRRIWAIRSRHKLQPSKSKDQGHLQEQGTAAIQDD